MACVFVWVRAYACGIRTRFAAGYRDAQYAGRCRLGMRAYGYGCGPACSTIGSTGTVCNDSGDGEYYSHPAVCTQVGDNKILVDSSTTMSDYTSCPKGCNAAGTGCVPCTNGAKQCNGNYVQTCVSGSWQDAASACPYGCEAGACKAPPCTNGAKQCNGNYVQTCVSGSWQNAASACPYGCEAGACKASPYDYIDCGTEDCSGDGSYTCNELCEDVNSSFLAYCYEYSGNMYVGCGLSCSKEGDTTQLCGTDSTGSYTFPAVCAKVGSKLIFVDNASTSADYKDCTGTCNAAGTACK